MQWKRLVLKIPFGIITDDYPQLHSPSKLLIPESWERFFITAPTSCRIGPSALIYHKEAKVCGDWMPPRLVPVLQAICWLIALILQSGSTEASKMFLR